MKPNILDIEQGSKEWHDLRKTKITATDSCVIMGASPWKTKLQLYHEKISDTNTTYKNQYMQRGLELEPIARELFNIKTGWDMKPTILVKDWAMASLDGRDASVGCIVEIKCPGEKDHALAIQGKIPPHYYPQIQHQIYVAQVQFAFYFSFDGVDGVIVEVKRDDDYIANMVQEELKFLKCLQDKTPPEMSASDFVQRDDDDWKYCAEKWKIITKTIKELEKEEEELRKQLIYLSGETNTKGAGISLCQVQRNGNVDYSKIPELKGVDLEPYRKASINSWRITCAH